MNRVNQFQSTVNAIQPKLKTLYGRMLCDKISKDYRQGTFELFEAIDHLHLDPFREAKHDLKLIYNYLDKEAKAS